MSYPQIGVIIKKGKVYYYFNTYNKKQHAIEQAMEYKKDEKYIKCKHYIIPYYKNFEDKEKKYALYMTKVIKLFV